MTNQKPFHEIAVDLDLNGDTEKREVTGCNKTTWYRTKIFLQAKYSIFKQSCRSFLTNAPAKILNLLEETWLVSLD